MLNRQLQHVVYHNDIIFKLYYDIIYSSRCGAEQRIETVCKITKNRCNEHERNRKFVEFSVRSHFFTSLFFKMNNFSGGIATRENINFWDHSVK